MRWLLAGYCGLALISISVALNHTLTGMIQRPRFYATQSKRDASFVCMTTKKHLLAKVEWYKADVYKTPQDAKILVKEKRIRITTKHYMNNMTQYGILSLRDLRPEDKGVYFCRIDGSWGPGTHLHVYRPYDPDRAAYRTKMKDGLMFLQGLLLAAFIGAVLLRKRKLLEKSDSIYEEPETDHIYEGLTIETCGGGLYEELSVYAQADGSEAPWE